MTQIKADEPRTYFFYKLVCNDTTVKDFYIGSTVNWVKRKHKHKQACTNPKHPGYNQPKYKTIRANGNWEKWSMIEIERGTYIKRSAETHEYDLMASMKSTMNKQKCFDSHSKCQHGIRKEWCKICKGSQICQHNKIKQYCKTCLGSSVCEHNYIDKRNCPYCSPYLCECGDWTTDGNKHQHFRTAKCKAFHMTTYGQVFI